MSVYALVFLNITMRFIYLIDGMIIWRVIQKYLDFRRDFIMVLNGLLLVIFKAKYIPVYLQKQNHKLSEVRLMV